MLSRIDCDSGISVVLNMFCSSCVLMICMSVFDSLYSVDVIVKFVIDMISSCFIFSWLDS